MSYFQKRRYLPIKWGNPFVSKQNKRYPLINKTSKKLIK